MTTTQIWMLCFVGVMVLLMILSAVWNQMGKKNRKELDKKSNTVIIKQKGELKK